MTTLVLGWNDFRGTIPEELGLLNKLNLLELSENQMSGSIPSSFSDLTDLQYLVLSGNNFNGTIDVLESLVNLTSLLIRKNSFSGTIPQRLFDGVEGELALDLGYNQFVGDVPSTFANLTNLSE
jgi:Leucine-rich repeat (LRR) protein